MTQAPPPPPETYSAPDYQPQKRPGGLTALAVLNFVLGALAAIGSLVRLALPSLAQKFLDLGKQAAQNSGDRAGAQKMAQASEQLSQLSAGELYLVAIVSLVVAALLIVSGMGYLKQSKGQGYVLGSTCAIVIFLDLIIQLALPNTHANCGTILYPIYAIVTLVLLNTVYKKCFRD